MSKTKILTMSSAGKSAEQVKLSDIAGGNAKWQDTQENSPVVA